MSIATEDFNFVDLVNFLAPGFSYSHLLKAYECQEMKGVFPYEWMDGLSKLEQTSLPPADAFYSKLRGTHISPDDYAHCQAVWEECGMETMKDFLIWYNNKDVQPMLEAIQKMVDFYKDLGLDMLKDGISVPGLTLKYLFKNLGSDTFFTLPDNEEVIGFDANALYLWAVGQQMPTEYYIRRQAETGFVKEYSASSRGQCDVFVPWVLKTNFAEMCPIFKNVDISIGDIGDHMKQYAETHGVMSRPRRSLIGSMFGQKILLATPLLKWYLEKGFVVEHIYQVLEYIPKRCFEPFVEAVSNARREGDRDDRKKVIAETMKLIGNSAYGKTVTNKEKQLKVEYFGDVVSTTRAINSPCFRQLSEVTENFYEVQSSKATIKLDLPLQIGFFVYQYAKLRMLQFYFDFMLEFVDVSDFQYCEMDTDSAYIAISADRLEDVIKPHMRERYENEKHLWFPRTDTPENAAYDKRTPGLFKEEWAGDGISPRDQSMVTTLAKQMFPGHSKFLQECYEDAVNKKTHGHLFLDLHPESPIELRVRSGMLTPQPYVYLRK
ncbi:hypothetical protein Bbelb_344100 [Branchiostoma belcheri]|nr:hypothetical protein Bbelb_344100 [Branchiostoma belcheri]